MLLPLGWMWSAAYLLFCLGSNLWFMRTICASCRLRGRSSCPSGYGRISARIASGRDPAGFAATFRRNIAAVALCWVFPPIGGALVLARSLRSPLEALFATVPLLAFCAVGFYALPALSGQGCRRCPMRGECPGSKVTVRQ